MEPPSDQRNSIYTQLNTIAGKLGNVEAKIDSLTTLVTDHIKEDRAVEARVRQLETTSTKHTVYSTIIGAGLALVGQKLLSFIKFQ